MNHARLCLQSNIARACLILLALAASGTCAAVPLSLPLTPLGTLANPIAVPPLGLSANAGVGAGLLTGTCGTGFGGGYVDAGGA
jgi:hypothetical protein